jgi:predicted flap endonuclease-1-like 5' DNA nuclease
MAKLEDIEGVGEFYASKLKEIGIETTDDLFEQGGSPAGRKKIASSSGIRESLVLEWVNHVDLFRVRGVGEEFADLLEAAGVDTIPELAQRNANHLYRMLADTNQQKNLVRRLPSPRQVGDWIQQAKGLPRKVTY